jgi:hypothetical protein
MNSPETDGSGEWGGIRFGGRWKPRTEKTRHATRRFSEAASTLRYAPEERASKTFAAPSEVESPGTSNASVSGSKPSNPSYRTMAFRLRGDAGDSLVFRGACRGAAGDSTKCFIGAGFDSSPSPGPGAEMFRSPRISRPRSDATMSDVIFGTRLVFEVCRPEWREAFASPSASGAGIVSAFFSRSFSTPLPRTLDGLAFSRLSAWRLSISHRAGRL